MTRKKISSALIFGREEAEFLGEHQALKYVISASEAEAAKQDLKLGSVLSVSFVPLSLMQERGGSLQCSWNELWYPLMHWWTEVRVTVIHELENK